MKTTTILFGFLATTTLVACGSDSNIDDLGAGATLAEAEAAFDALATRVTDIEFAEGSTLEIDLPADSATYTGIVSGGLGVSGGEGGIDHYADLSLTAEFGFDSLTGSATNFVTDQPGFENPTGTVNYTGSISNDGGAATIIFSGTGILSQGANEVEWDTITANGAFVGDDGTAIEGFQLTDVNSISGPIDGFSDGEFYAERD